MDDVYVRLDTLGDGEGERQDACAQVRATRNTVVVGPPGVGKSMLVDSAADLPYLAMRGLTESDVLNSIGAHSHPA